MENPKELMIQEIIRQRDECHRIMMKLLRFVRSLRIDLDEGFPVAGKICDFLNDGSVVSDAIEIEYDVFGNGDSEGGVLKEHEILMYDFCPKMNS